MTFTGSFTEVPPEPAVCCVNGDLETLHFLMEPFNQKGKKLRQLSFEYYAPYNPYLA